jgi:hypothetical protein
MGALGAGARGGAGGEVDEVTGRRAAVIGDGREDVRAGEALGALAGGDRDGGHAGATRALDAERRILEHDRARGVRAEAPRGEQEEVGGGLALRDVVRAGDRVELVGHPEPRQRERDVARVARGGARDADPFAPRGARELAESGDLAEVRREQLAVQAFLLVHERPRRGVAHRAEQLAHDLGAGATRGAAQERLALVGDAVTDEERFPRAAVPGHRVDDRAVDVEDERGRRHGSGDLEAGRAGRAAPRARRPPGGGARSSLRGDSHCTPCFRLAAMKSSRSPSSTRCVSPTSWLVRRSLMRDWSST